MFEENFDFVVIPRETYNVSRSHHRAKVLPTAKLLPDEHDLHFIIFNHISRLNEKVSLSF